MPFDFACPDWEERLRDGRTPIPDLPLDEDEADRGAAIFGMLRLPDVPGQPTQAESAGRWIFDIVRAIFGSMDTSAAAFGARQVGEVFILVPKKNSKTTSAAGIALTFMLMNERKNADLLIIAPTQKIAETGFNQAKGMIEADVFLTDRFHIRNDLKMIVDRVTKARLIVKTFATDVLTGVKLIFCLIDELHLLGKMPHAAEVLRQVRGGFIPFPEACLVIITTQSEEPPRGVFKSELNFARGVRDGKITGEHVATLAVLYEFPDAVQSDDDKPWLDSRLWHMVTPNLGHSIDLKRLEAGLFRAQEDGPEAVMGWATQHLNIQIGRARYGDSWITADFWPATADADVGLQRILDECDVIVTGGDVGGADDLFGFAVIGRKAGSRNWTSWVRAWCTELALERRKSIATLLREFETDGDLVILETSDTAITEIADICEDIRSANKMPDDGAIGLDAFGAAGLTEELFLREFTEDQIRAVPQGFKLSGAIDGLEHRVINGRLRHADQPMMDWCLANARVEMRGRNKYITKQVAGVAKIDPLIALINAAVLMDMNPEPPRAVNINDFLSQPVMVA